MDEMTDLVYKQSKFKEDLGHQIAFELYGVV